MSITKALPPRMGRPITRFCYTGEVLPDSDNIMCPTDQTPLDAPKDIANATLFHMTRHDGGTMADRAGMFMSLRFLGHIRKCPTCRVAYPVEFEERIPWVNITGNNNSGWTTVRSGTSATGTVRMDSQGNIVMSTNP